MTLSIDTLISSPRIHDLSSTAGVRTFLSAVAAGDEAMDDDLSGWLYSAGASGCNTVLQRVGL